ncbi:MAG: Hemolysin C [Alphaproteobacteria bacterium MarineAlpha5_Bin12]|nr:hypothetical protein [Pelagibacteraceae bacterium]PPR41169.1 MAG: Hemolysin C [Alphaproteobacteria bacterium MarineAlpha5_Bin12]|tara:strand:- start:18219 stop:19094 length:876 start_codon:yes stop_codon:yes gene_type:complete
MNNKSIKSEISKNSWRLWLVKKLLKDHINKEEIYTFISSIFENGNKLKESFEKPIDDSDENELLRNILKLNDKTVEDVMVPRADIVAISIKDSFQKILDTIDYNSHSRMPIFEDNLDNVMGMIHIKDIISNIEKKDFKIKEIIRDILYVAPSSPVLDLLKRMRKSKIHLGLVVDEHGGVDGLVTIEDLVEEIVGEIEDEHDAEDNEIKIKKINSKTFIIDTSLSLKELENLIKINLDNEIKEEINSVGGLIYYLAGKIPLVGEKFIYNDQVSFEIISVNQRRIEEVKVLLI